MSGNEEAEVGPRREGAYAEVPEGSNLMDKEAAAATNRNYRVDENNERVGPETETVEADDDNREANAVAHAEDSDDLDAEHDDD